MPSLGNAVGPRSKFCFTLTWNSTEWPLQSPRVTLRSGQTDTEQAPCLPVQSPGPARFDERLLGRLSPLAARDSHFPAPSPIFIKFSVF